MRLGLAGANIVIPGRLTVNKGPLRGKSIEPRQVKMSGFLKRLWGAPEVYESKSAAMHGLGNRNGVVSFFSINGAGTVAQGHIDLVEAGGNNFYTCFMKCHFDHSLTTWLWPLL